MSKGPNLSAAGAMDVGRARDTDTHAPVASYLRQLNTLILARHLTLLMIEAQKHRGASMAVLAGNREFESRVNQSQRLIQRYLDVIQQLNQQAGGLIPEEKWQGINRDWQALIEHWHTDPAMINFEFHNRFIDRLLKLVWELVDQARLVEAGRPSEGMAHMVLSVTLKLMPELLENIARVRGLATHVCSLGHSDMEFDSRFVSLMHSLNMNKEKMRIISRGLRHDILRAVPSLPEILLHDHKLDQLQHTVGSRITGADRIRLNSEELFDFASDVIDTYSQVIHDGITFFRRRLERELGVSNY